MAKYHYCYTLLDLLLGKMIALIQKKQLSLKIECFYQILKHNKQSQSNKIILKIQAKTNELVFILNKYIYSKYFFAFQKLRMNQNRHLDDKKKQIGIMKDKKRQIIADRNQILKNKQKVNKQNKMMRNKLSRMLQLMNYLATNYQISFQQ